jgi:para-nitrobenzyl esterase
MSTTAHTNSGAVEGELRANHVAFRGIPFAAPPIGKKRFAAPEPPEPWSSVRPAREFGPSAIQGQSFAPGAAAEGPTSEDCLYLNVYTPGLDGRRRPVLVFIHGGGFVVGSSSSPLYEGGRLAELGDQVVVTFNYRLAAFGYLCLGDVGSRLGVTTNAGILDQLAALRWVNANIERFGGDPANVTVFGESAGGSSAILLMAMPSASGLFKQAIAQSPGPALDLAEPEVAVDHAEQLLRALDLSLADSGKLRDLPAEAIRTAQGTVRGRPGDWLGFFPVLDPETLPEQPRRVFARGDGAAVPLVVGHNRDEWNLFDLPTREDPERKIDIARALLAKGFPPQAQDRLPHLLDTYRKSRAHKALPHHDAALMRAILGDMRFRLPSVRTAELHAARGLPTYAYFFSYSSPALGGALGACHALELPFVFGNLDAPQQERFAGKGEAVRALSAEMMQAWSHFARTGTPGDSWPRFDVEQRATRVFDTPSRIERAPHDEERAEWDGLF